jgi:hypothetical protein
MEQEDNGIYQYNGYIIEIWDTEEACTYSIIDNGINVYMGGSENPSDCIFNAQYRIDLKKFN